MSDIEQQNNNVVIEDKETDDKTVVSEDLSPEEYQDTVHFVSTRGNKKVLIFSLSLAALLVSVIAIASVYGKPSSSPTKVEPEVLNEPEDMDSKYDLLDSFPEAEAMSLREGDGKRFAVLDPETGCLKVQSYSHGSDELAPLCFTEKHDKEILSLYMQHHSVVVGREHSVEIWELKSNEWQRIAHVKKTVDGFGKDVALARGDSLLISSDAQVYYYQLRSDGKYTMRDSWVETKSFDVTEEKFAILYADNSVQVYDIAARNAAEFINLGSPSKTYESNVKIDSIVIDENNHVQAASLIEDADKLFKKQSVFTKLVVQDKENGSSLSFPSNYQWLVNSDFVYSPSSGYIYSLRLGEYLGLEVDADHVHDIQSVGSYVAVAAERDGKNVVEVYEASEP